MDESIDEEEEGVEESITASSKEEGEKKFSESLSLFQSLQVKKCVFFYTICCKTNVSSHIGGTVAFFKMNNNLFSGPSQ